jgi:hypothetical protein
MSAENYKIAYQELCTSYRAIDNFRTALLGLLPLASLTGIFLLYNNNKEITSETLRVLGSFGLFGFAVTLGLFLFEIYGIRKCHALIDAGKRFEELLGVEGQFTLRPRAVIGVINEPFASGIIYPAVLAAWAFVGLYPICPVASGVIALLLFGIGFALSLWYNFWLKSANGAAVRRPPQPAA